MAGRGPAPKPAALRQRTNKRVGVATLETPEPETVDVPAIPNPDGRAWHPLTVKAWEHAWRSPMASQWLETDMDALGRLALLWDVFYGGAVLMMAEIRLQEARFGLSPLDRSRLSWEIARGAEAEKKTQRPEPSKPKVDPRKVLQMVGVG